MPLDVLLILVVGGIAAIALLLHLMGKSSRRILSLEDVRTDWHRHFPDDRIINVIVSADRHAALVQTDQGPGLLWAFGADTVARHLRDFDFIDRGTHQDILFHDYTAPKATLRLSSEERDQWQARMRPQ